MNGTWVLREGDRERAVSVRLKDGVLRGDVGGIPFPEIRVERDGAGILLVRGRASDRALVARDGARLWVHLRGRVHEFLLPEAGEARRGKDGRRAHGGDDPFAASPMTGTVVQVPVKAGDAVPAGGTLAVVEAMKMQFVVRAPRDVVVKGVNVAPGQSVAIGGVLVQFEEPTEST